MVSAIMQCMTQIALWRILFLVDILFCMILFAACMISSIVGFESNILALPFMYILLNLNQKEQIRATQYAVSVTTGVIAVM